MKYQKYDAYKDSGVQWLGKIPNDWDVKRLKFLLEEINIRSSLGTETLLSLSKYKGIIPKDTLDEKSGGAESLVGYKKVFKKNLVINKMQAVNGLLAVSKIEGITSPDYSIYQAKNEELANIDFINYVLLQPEYLAEMKRRVTGVMEGFIRLYTDDLFDIGLILPSLIEQNKIVDFLNQKTTQIDQAIAIKEQQIALLNERKQIVIQNAVTKGLDPNVKMKDSGVEWIGKIPEHWEVRRSKFIFGQRKELARKNDIQLSATQAYGVIPQEEYEKRTGKSVVKISMHLEKRKRVHLDDFVISMRSFQGGLERAWANGCIRSSYVVLKALMDINPTYYAYLFKTPTYIKALQNTSNFIRDGQDLNFNNFAQVDLFLVPKTEQDCIVNFITDKLGNFDQHIDLLSKQIQKLKEYKTTLINDAVTGKIKVA